MTQRVAIDGVWQRSSVCRVLGNVCSERDGSSQVWDGEGERLSFIVESVMDGLKASKGRLGSSVAKTRGNGLTLDETQTGWL